MLPKEIVRIEGLCPIPYVSIYHAEGLLTTQLLHTYIRHLSYVLELTAGPFPLDSNSFPEVRLEHGLEHPVPAERREQVEERQQQAERRHDRAELQLGPARK